MDNLKFSMEMHEKIIRYIWYCKIQTIFFKLYNKKILFINNLDISNIHKDAKQN